jgi:hypothetical protein
MIINAKCDMVFRNIGKKNGGTTAAGFRRILHGVWQYGFQLLEDVVGKATMGMHGTFFFLFSRASIIGLFIVSVVIKTGFQES